MKKLAYVIPLGTLLALVVAFVVSRWWSPRAPLPPVVAGAVAKLPPLDFPHREGRIAGRLEDPQGEPVVRATLWLQVGSELWFTESGADGVFTFDHVQPGERVLGVVADGFAPQRWTLPEAQSLEHVVLERATAPPPSLPPMKRSTLRGEVRAPGTQVDGWQVCFAPRVPSSTLGAPLPVRAECGADGRFAFEELIEGEYTVQLLPRWAANGSWPDLLRPLMGTEPLLVRHAEGAHPAGLVLEPVAGSLRGTLLDASGTPLEGALVLVTPAADAARVWPPVSSEAAGGFLCADLPPGKYTVSVRAGSDAVQLEVELGASEAKELNVRPLQVARAR